MSQPLRQPMCVMVGPGQECQGGVASVIAAYAQAGLFADGSVLLISSYSGGSLVKKLAVAALAMLSYARILLRGQAPVLHVHVCSRASFWRKSVFIWMALLMRRRIVVHLHGGGFQLFIEQLPVCWRALALSTLKRCDLLLCLTSLTHHWVSTLAPDLQSRWWPNPVSETLIEANALSQLRAPVLLYLGALLPAKGLLDLLAAFQKLHVLDPTAHLLIAGAGPQQNVLQRAIADGGLQQCVTLLGWIGAAEKHRWLRCARVFVLPSYLEAQPMVLLEAMACGVAIVSTNVGGIPDVIDDNVEGILVPAHDVATLTLALQLLWLNGDLRQRLATSATLRVLERHRAATICLALRQLYLEQTA